MSTALRRALAADQAELAAARGALRRWLERREDTARRGGRVPTSLFTVELQPAVSLPFVRAFTAAVDRVLRRVPDWYASDLFPSFVISASAAPMAGELARTEGDTGGEPRIRVWPGALRRWERGEDHEFLPGLRGSLLLKVMAHEVAHDLISLLRARDVALWRRLMAATGAGPRRVLGTRGGKGELAADLVATGLLDPRRLARIAPREATVVAEAMRALASERRAGPVGE